MTENDKDVSDNGNMTENDKDALIERLQKENAQLRATVAKLLKRIDGIGAATGEQFAQFAQTALVRSAGRAEETRSGEAKETRRKKRA